MGWASGSDLMCQIIRSVKTHVPDKEVRIRIYIDTIEAFQDHDCDTLDEAEGLDKSFDEALAKFYPPEEGN